MKGLTKYDKQLCNYLESLQNQITELQEEVSQLQVNKDYVNYFDFSSNSVTNITVIGQWYKLNTSTTLGFLQGDFVHTNNRITYVGTDPVILKLEGIASGTTGNNNELHFAFFISDGTVPPSLWPCSEQETTTGPGGKASSCAFHCVAQLEQNWFVEVWTKNNTSATDLTLDNVNVIITEL